MALLDDADFIITHIRHSCVTSDDTGKLGYKVYSVVVTLCFYMAYDLCKRVGF